VRVVAFNTAEEWSQHVSADVAHKLRRRCDLRQRDIPFFLQNFVDHYEGPRHPAAAPDRAGLTRGDPAQKPAAIGIKAPYPGFIEPALAASISKVPSGERWIHEIKFDGYRVARRPKRSRSTPAAATTRPNASRRLRTRLGTSGPGPP
jgi:hypothetical protein